MSHDDSCLVMCCLQPGESYFTSLVRLDVESGAQQVWQEEGTYPGEPIFVPRPGGSQEDDGLLLSVVLAGQSYVTILIIMKRFPAHTELGKCWTNLVSNAWHQLSIDIVTASP